MTQSLVDPLMLQRRAFLRATTAAAAAIALPSWGCARREVRTVAPMLAELDPNAPWWLQQNFGPVVEERDVASLAVRGAIPPELDGVYVRNGSNAQNGQSTHWFLGDGMIHGVRLSGGNARWYKNRYVRTPWYESKTQLGAPGGPNTQANVSLVHHGGRLLASGEVGFPYAIDPSDLSTVGFHDFDGRLDTSFTAHPAIDPQTGAMHFFGYGFEEPFVTYHVADRAGALVHSEAVDARAPTMMHSFAITDRDVVFWELPVVFDLDEFDRSGWFFRWDSGLGARIGVMPLGGPASALRWVDVEPCYVYHAANAFREGDDVVVDVCRYREMMNGERFGSVPTTLVRWRVGTGGDELTFSETMLSDRSFEFPYTDRRFAGRPNRYSWYTTFRSNPAILNPAGVARYDAKTGKLDEWEPGPARQSGEPLFVDAGGTEGEGWLLTYVYDAERRSSDLAVFDATAVRKGPVAEVLMPNRVPHGFHGAWVPA
ncbi:MAG: carotenoid oxygenase family protein [Myxococcota bacterium]